MSDLLMRRLETAQHDCMAEGQAAAAILLQDARAEIARLREALEAILNAANDPYEIARDALASVGGSIEPR